ncbi:VOC family protein [Colwellia hornerae]|uniref:VOC family protein n=1 Tax=Colwellia hornerae TaxID=89402 RepID=A0A5C6QMS4_9GAMM|nr:VOC family protein [Colwellia hornerae]TWX54602.1 VOC family protein [Colwellia hornerae]TWX61042.1 VOC family protein [Colwellia hornerae]TWX70295.1 VOC family protein [Colwellia hornerae]
MSNKIGEMAWLDLTVDNASEIKDFYQRVIGWQVEDVAMGEHNDYVMKSPDSGEAISGICHATGGNAGMPATWLPYFLVEDINNAVANVTELGGELLTEIKQVGKDSYVMVKDPAGAVCSLYQKG